MLIRHCIMICHTINTADGTWAKSVVIKTQGYEQILVIVMLAISVDVRALPPSVILNHKTMAKE